MNEEIIYATAKTLAEAERGQMSPERRLTTTLAGRTEAFAESLAEITKMGTPVKIARDRLLREILKAKNDA